MTAMLALPGPEAWGREADNAECEACGGHSLHFDPTSDSHRRAFDELEGEDGVPSGGWWFDGDMAHCLDCGQPHIVRCDEYATLSVPYGEATVINARALTDAPGCRCGWPDVDHHNGEVSMAVPFWDGRYHPPGRRSPLRDVVLWAGVVPASLRRDGHMLRAPCALLAKRRGAR